jgi:pimeloyl-ACP methyl ester carboxylesterase
MIQSALEFPEVYEGGSGSPLVLLHGFGVTWRMWKPLFALLEPHHRVIAPTLPGHSGGLAMDEPASPLTISNALARQLRARGIGNAHFVGQSLGGFCVLEMVRHGLARSAMGLSPAGTWRDEEEKRAFMRNARATYRKLPYLIPVMWPLLSVSALRKRILGNEMEHGERVPPAEARDVLRRIKTLSIVEDYLDENVQAVKPLPADSRVPLCVAWGGCDRVLPFDSYGQPLLDLLGLKSYVDLPGCGHNPVYDDTQGVASAILKFTRSVEVGAAS